MIANNITRKLSIVVYLVLEALQLFNVCKWLNNLPFQGKISATMFIRKSREKKTLTGKWRKQIR